jgi:hypothetical protein
LGTVTDVHNTEGNFIMYDYVLALIIAGIIAIVTEFKGDRYPPLPI